MLAPTASSHLALHYSSYYETIFEMASLCNSVRYIILEDCFILVKVEVEVKERVNLRRNGLGGDIDRSSQRVSTSRTFLVEFTFIFLISSARRCTIDLLCRGNFINLIEH